MCIYTERVLITADVSVNLGYRTYSANIFYGKIGGCHVLNHMGGEYLVCPIPSLSLLYYVYFLVGVISLAYSLVTHYSFEHISSTYVINKQSPYSTVITQ